MTTAKFNLDQHSAIARDALAPDQSQSGVISASDELAAKAELALILELATTHLTSGNPADLAIERLAKSLHDLRAKTNPGLWHNLLSVGRGHRVFDQLIQDPFTRWSYEKPRGYSGDATLLDIYYQHPAATPIVESSSALGQQIYAYTSNAASSVAGRERCQILADYVDRAANEVPGAEVLSVACGHLREGEKSNALKNGALSRWVAFDQDPESIDTVTSSYPDSAVRPVEGNVRGLIRNSYDLGTFDLVYASGLYDYLGVKIGVKVMQTCMNMLKPGGVFMFANFSDEITTDGYMEMFMDWPLLLRNEDDMWAIIDGAVDRNKVEAKVYYGSNRNIVYAEVRKLS